LDFDFGTIIKDWLLGIRKSRKGESKFFKIWPGHSKFSVAFIFPSPFNHFLNK
jgi:hypothetical protein